MIRAANVALELARQAIPAARVRYARGRWVWGWSGACVVLTRDAVVGVAPASIRGCWASTPEGLQALVARVALALFAWGERRARR